MFSVIVLLFTICQLIVTDAPIILNSVSRLRFENISKTSLEQLFSMPIAIILVRHNSFQWVLKYFTSTVMVSSPSHFLVVPLQVLDFFVGKLCMLLYIYTNAHAHIFHFSQNVPLSRACQNRYFRTASGHDAPQFQFCPSGRVAASGDFTLYFKNNTPHEHHRRRCSFAKCQKMTAVSNFPTSTL